MGEHDGIPTVEEVDCPTCYPTDYGERFAKNHYFTMSDGQYKVTDVWNRLNFTYKRRHLTDGSMRVEIGSDLGKEEGYYTSTYCLEYICYGSCLAGKFCNHNHLCGIINDADRGSILAAHNIEQADAEEARQIHYAHWSSGKTKLLAKKYANKSISEIAEINMVVGDNGSNDDGARKEKFPIRNTHQGTFIYANMKASWPAAFGSLSKNLKDKVYNTNRETLVKTLPHLFDIDCASTEQLEIEEVHSRQYRSKGYSQGSTYHFRMPRV